MAVWSVFAIGARSGPGSRCGFMECAQAVLWLERVGHCRLGGMRCLLNWALLNIAKRLRGIADHLAPWV